MRGKSVAINVGVALLFIVSCVIVWSLANEKNVGLAVCYSGGVKIYEGPFSRTMERGVTVMREDRRAFLVQGDCLTYPYPKEVRFK